MSDKNEKNEKNGKNEKGANNGKDTSNARNTNSEKREKNGNRGFWFTCVLLTIVTAVSCFAYLREYHTPSLEPSVEMGMPEEDNHESEQPEADVSPGESEVLYEPPDYDFKLDEITVEIEGLTRGYDIAFVNDLHLITDSEPGDVLEENLPTVKERYNTFSVTPEGIHAEELWPEIVRFLNYYNFDAIVFGGDMLDYCSQSNMSALSEGFENLKYPKEKIIYIRADHDYGGWYGGSTFTDEDGFKAHSKLWDGDDSTGCIEFEDFLIVGVNKSYQNLSDERLLFLKQKLEAGKPVIVATHVPYYSQMDDSLEELSLNIRNRIYYWDKEESVYCPDENTQEFIDCMYDKDSNVVQILAAHMHASWDGRVAGDLKEHIFAPSFQGRIGIVHVVKADEKKESGK